MAKLRLEAGIGVIIAVNMGRAKKTSSSGKGFEAVIRDEFAPGLRPDRLCFRQDRQGIDDLQNWLRRSARPKPADQSSVLNDLLLKPAAWFRRQ